MKRRAVYASALTLMIAAAAGVSWRLLQLDDDRVMTLAIRAVDGRSTLAQTELRAAALLGNTIAMRIDGIVLTHGNERERARGLALLERAARRGDARSARQLGEIYLGRAPGAAQADAVLARAWFLRAAQTGDRDAAFRLGRLLREAGDDPGALHWTRIAADAGQADAMFALGNAYADGGQGVARDTTQALRWYRRGAERNQAESLQALGMAYLHGELGLPRDEQRGQDLIAVSGEMAEHQPGSLLAR